MVFSSIVFLCAFLPLTLAIYYAMPRARNEFLLFASLLFYAWGELQFLPVLAASVVVNYASASVLRHTGKRRIWLALGLSANLAVLFFFKYIAFLDANVHGLLGWHIPGAWRFSRIPLGISFFTFQAMSYLIDVSRGDAPQEHRFRNVALYITMFPQLIAGPIVRFKDISSELQSRVLQFSRIASGTRLFVLGLASKVLLANTLAVPADAAFSAGYDQLGADLAWLGLACYSLQIYFDFSGYSLMAIGLGQMLGFTFPQNFDLPYLSQSITDFWRRWHISLSTWFRDYLYIPLGGSKGGTAMKVRNTFAIFVVSGFWHGANWTFIVWGLLNALYFLPLLLTNKNRSNLGVVAHGRWIPSLRDALKMTMTFGLTIIAWVFFRAENVGHALAYLKRMATNLVSKQAVIDCYNHLYWEIGATLPLSIMAFMAVEWLNRDWQFGLERMPKSRALRWALYALVLFAIQFLGNFNETEFIYFAF